MIRSLRNLPPVMLWLVTVTAAGADFPGVSIAAPGGNPWIQVQDAADSQVWMRNTGREDLTLGVALLTGPAPENLTERSSFVDWVTRTKEYNPDPRRFRLVSNRIQPAEDHRPSCVRYATVVEDRSAGTAPAATLRLEVAGLACLHPDAPGRFIDVQYSARMPSGDTLPAELRREGEAFVESVRFRPPPADGDWSLGNRAATPGRRQAT